MFVSLPSDRNKVRPVYTSNTINILKKFSLKKSFKSFLVSNKKTGKHISILNMFVMALGSGTEKEIINNSGIKSSGR